MARQSQLEQEWLIPLSAEYAILTVIAQGSMKCPNALAVCVCGPLRVGVAQAALVLYLTVLAVISS